MVNLPVVVAFESCRFRLDDHDEWGTTDVIEREYVGGDVSFIFR